MVNVTQGIINLNKDIDLLGVPEVTLEVASSLPKADRQAAQVFLYAGEVKESQVIMVVVIMMMMMIVIMVILKEMT